MVIFASLKLANIFVKLNLLIFYNFHTHFDKELLKKSSFAWPQSKPQIPKLQITRAYYYFMKSSKVCCYFWGVCGNLLKILIDTLASYKISHIIWMSTNLLFTFLFLTASVFSRDALCTGLIQIWTVPHQQTRILNLINNKGKFWGMKTRKWSEGLVQIIFDTFLDDFRPPRSCVIAPFARIIWMTSYNNKNLFKQAQMQI